MSKLTADDLYRGSLVTVERINDLLEAKEIGSMKRESRTGEGITKKCWDPDHVLWSRKQYVWRGSSKPPAVWRGNR